MHYSLIKVIGETKNYFIKTNYPVRNRKEAQKEILIKYKELKEENKILILGCSFIEYYLGIIFAKMINRG
jgi:hypothetical protein